MLLEMCVMVIAVAVVILVVIGVRMGMEMRTTVKELQEDVRLLSGEMTLLVGSLNQFVKEDLHELSEEAKELVVSLNELSDEMKGKLGLGWLKLFRLGSDSNESENKCETIPQIMKWIATSVNLFKEFVGKYGKRTN